MTRYAVVKHRFLSHRQAVKKVQWYAEHQIIAQVFRENKIFRVAFGIFFEKDNAVARRNEMKEKGYNCSVRTIDE